LNLPPAPVPAFSLPSGSYPNTQTVTISDTAPSAAIFYTANGAFLQGGVQYSGALTVSTSETVAAYAIAPGYSQSAITSSEYIIDSSSSSFIYTVAGTGIYGYSGDSGPATLADLNGTAGVAVVPSGLSDAGDFYIADSENNRIRKVAGATGIITTVAGTGIGGYSGDNGPATSAQLLYPSAVAVDRSGNLWILDSGNTKIRMVAAATGTITTVNVNGLGPQGFALDHLNNLYVISNNRVWEVLGSSNVPVAGTGSYGFTGDGGPAISATLGFPGGISVSSGGGPLHRRHRQQCHSQGDSKYWSHYNGRWQFERGRIYLWIPLFRLHGRRWPGNESSTQFSLRSRLGW
jgi:hypothetical protein